MLAETFRRDVRVGFRILVKEKSFCALAVFVLALGICGVTTMFGVVNGVMLRGFSFPNADRITSIRFIDPSSGSFFGFNGRLSAMDFEEFRPAQKSFDLVAAYLNGSTVNVTIDGQPQRYTGVYCTEAFLRILGVAPILGRDFTAADNVPNGPHVALISHAIWQRDFGGSADVVGKGIRINGKPGTVVGVMPQGFNFPTNEDVWLPLYPDFPVRPRDDARAVGPAVVGLIRRDVTLEQANAEFGGFARRFAEAYPDTNRQFSAALVEPLIVTFTPRPLRGTLLTMLAFCGGLLLIACFNVMNMQFARATLRARELAIRASLGATRARLVRQMLTESLLVAAMGAAIGVALAYVATDWLTATVRNLDNPLPSWIRFDIDAGVLVFTVIATLAAAVVSGLLPAWMASRANVNAVLREGGRGGTSRTMLLVSRGLVVVQIIVTCVLLIGSLLQVRSIVKQQTIDYGYDTQGVLSARMGLMDGDYPTAEARRVFYDRVVRELGTAPEFEAVGLTTRFRMVFSGNVPIEIEGRAYSGRRDRPNTNFEQVAGGFFDVTGQKVVEGRALAETDLDQRQPVAVVNAAFARRHFGTGSAVGRRFRTVDANEQPGPWRTIVGVVSTVRMSAPFNTPNVDDTGFYLPFYATVTGSVLPAPFVNQFATVVVKPRGGQRPDALATPLRRAINRIDPNLPLYFVGTPRYHLDTFVGANRVLAAMFTAFGLVAVVLAGVGIYGVMSFSVSQRTQEFGVRMALGADRTRILGMVLRQGSVQLALGLLVGIGSAFTIARIGGAAIGNALFGVNATDPVSYLAVVSLVTIVSITATLVPARRATAVDPMVALRAE